MQSSTKTFALSEMRLLKSIKGSVRILARPMIRFLKPVPPNLLEPMSRRWGFERGTPISRWYIDRFLEANRQDIKGSVLEIKNARYTKSLGYDITHSDILDIDRSNSDATIFADLATADQVPSEKYDCFILTETLQFVFDLESAIAHAHRILKPNGILLVSVPCVQPRDDELAAFDHWRFTILGCEKLFAKAFGSENVSVEGYGNYAASVGMLSGLAVEELPSEALTLHDGKYTTGVFVRAKRV